MSPGVAYGPGPVVGLAMLQQNGFDVGMAEAVRTGVGAVVDALGGLDILVNNAGIARDALVLRLKEEDWEAVLRTDLTGVFLCTKVAARVMLKAREGRVRTVAVSGLPTDVQALVAPFGVTLVQLSTTFCAPCRHARVLLADMAAKVEGLHHTELDLTDRPDLARELSVLRTPTTLAIDGQGAEILRVGGVPKRDELLAALRAHLPSH